MRKSSKTKERKLNFYVTVFFKLPKFQTLSMKNNDKPPVSTKYTSGEEFTLPQKALVHGKPVSTKDTGGEYTIQE